MTGVSLATRRWHVHPLRTIRPLVALVHAPVPLSVLFGATEFDAAAVAFVRANPRVSGITHFTTLDMQAIRHLTTYVTLPGAARRRLRDDGSTTDAADLRHASRPSPRRFAATDRGRLRHARVERPSWKRCCRSCLPDNAPTRWRLAAAADLCSYPTWARTV
jgi:hypothetical protein